jgi:hypothetical protein
MAAMEAEPVDGSRAALGRSQVPGPTVLLRLVYTKSGGCVSSDPDEH